MDRFQIFRNWVYPSNDLFHKTTPCLYRQNGSESPEQCLFEAKF